MAIKNEDEQIVQAMSGILEYNLAENDKILKFDYKEANSYQSFHKKKKDIYMKLLKMWIYFFKRPNRRRRF